jgi:DNA-binding transcriptional ArsR family regulator
VNDPLAELLSSRVRAAVLVRFVAQPTPASLTELARTLHLSISSVQHECYKLERLGILVARREGGSRRYRLAPDSPLVDPLIHLVWATRNRKALLTAALRELPGLERVLLVPPANGAHPAPTHLVVIGEVPLDQLEVALDRTATLLDLPPEQLSLAFYRPADWHARVAEGNALVQRLLAAEHMVLVGESER